MVSRISDRIFAPLLGTPRPVFINPTIRIYKDSAWSLVSILMMHDEELNHQDEKELSLLIERYELMEAREEATFFDLSEFEALIEHYLLYGKHNRARIVLRYARELYPESLGLQLRDAQILAGSGELDHAIPRLLNLLAFEPQNEEIHLTLASLYSQTHQHLKAIRHFRKVMDFCDPETKGELYIDIALEYENLGHWDMAVQMLSEAVTHNPENETALHELSFCLETIGQNDRAIKVFQELIDQHPYSCPAWLGLGNALQRKSAYEKAIQAYEYCLVINEDFSPALFQKAGCLTLLERYHEAVECYHDTIVMDAPQAATYCMMGECMERLEKLSEAEGYYRAALDLDQDYADAHIGLGVIFDLRDQSEASLRCMEKAVSLDPGHVDYQLLLGNANKKAGNFLKAKALYDNALRLSPNNIDVWIEAIDNLQIEGLHSDALALIADATGSVAANLRIGFRRFVSLHASSQRKEAFKLFDILLERESTENRELIEYYPEIQEDPDFCMRTSHRRKA